MQLRRPFQPEPSLPLIPDCCSSFLQCTIASFNSDSLLGCSASTRYLSLPLLAAMSTGRAGVVGSYSSRTLIGNWSEEHSLHQLRIAEFLHRRQHHQLLIQHVDTQSKDALQDVGLSYSEDGAVHFGDHVMLYSAATQGVLACDPSDKAVGGEESFAVTTSTVNKTHVARNTFIVEPYQQSRDGSSPAAVRSGDVLHYGQLFRLRVNGRLCGGEGYYLHSQPLGGSASSKVSRKQEVCMSRNGSTFDTVWKCAGRDVNSRFQLDTTAVAASSELVILHAATSQALSSSPLRYINDFGAEYEVCAHTHTHTAKNHGLQAERLGIKTGEEVARREHLDNHWAILTAATRDRQALLNRDSQHTIALITATLTHVRDSVLRQGVEALHQLSRQLWLADGGGASECVEYSVLAQLLSRTVSGLNREDLELICNHFDSANDGHCDYRAFLASIRGGEMSDARKQAVMTTFHQLDARGEDSVNVDEMQQRWKGKGPFTADLWSIYGRVSGRVSVERFVDFYWSESCYIEQDEFFFHLLTSSWSA